MHAGRIVTEGQACNAQEMIMIIKIADQSCSKGCKFILFVEQALGGTQVVPAILRCSWFNEPLEGWSSISKMGNVRFYIINNIGRYL